MYASDSAESTRPAAGFRGFPALVVVGDDGIEPPTLSV